MRLTPELTLERLKGHAAAYLAGREMSAEELRRKLLLLGADPDRVQQVLEEFRERGWQDDHRVLAWQQRMAERKGWGPLRLRQQLQGKGLDTELIAEGLRSQGAEDWIERAVAVLRNKFPRSISHDERIEGKMMRFLAYRGYSQGQAMQAMKRWKQEGAEQDAGAHLPGDQR